MCSWFHTSSGGSSGDAAVAPPSAAALVQRGMLRLPPAVQGSASARPSPSLLLLPGLASRPWWEPSDARFAPWLAPLLAAAASGALIAEQEALAAAAASTAGSDYALRADEHRLHRGAWAWQTLMARGTLQPAAALLAPTTTALLARAPLMTGTPFSYAFFSRMGAGTEIAPHFGPTNLRLRLHVPLRVPRGGAAVAGLAVAGEVRGYDAGPLIFDDAYEHAAWNRSDAGERRDVLLFDIWHPDLAADEIGAVQATFRQAKARGWLK